MYPPPLKGREDTEATQQYFRAVGLPILQLSSEPQIPYVKNEVRA